MSFSNRPRTRRGAAHHVGLAAVCFGCGGPPGPNVAASPSFVVDDPEQCLDQSAPPDRPWELQGSTWVREVERAVDRELARVQCATAQGSATFALEFDRYGNPSKAIVTASTLTDCDIVECLKSTLERVMAPPLRVGEALRYVQTIVLAPGSAPRRAAREERVTRSSANSRCAPLPSHAEGPEPSIQSPPSEAIREVVLASFPKLRACYDRARVVDTDLRGAVTTTFVVGAGGRVSSAHVTANTLPNCDVVRCVRDTFLQFRFPEPEDRPVVAVYPLYFTPLEDSFERLDPSEERGRLAPGVLGPSW
jgi:hypothetical protein